MPIPRGSSRPRDWTRVFSTAGGFFTTETAGKPYNRLLLNNKQTLPIDQSVPMSLKNVLLKQLGAEDYTTLFIWIVQKRKI